MNVEKMEVDRLKPHPLSHELFGDMPEVDMVDLKQSIQKRGLQHMIEVDMQGRVICGSQRLRAIRELGWRVVEVQKRDDLETEEEIEEHLIRDNTERRHLSAMQRYRAAKHLENLYSKETKVGRPKKEEDSTEEKSLSTERNLTAQEKAAKDMDMSGATMHRLKKIQESGRTDIIEAVDKGDLSVSAGHAALRHQAPSGGDHTEQLQFFQFKRKIEEFERYVTTHPQGKYETYDKEIISLLTKTQTLIADWIHNESIQD
jgi:ParB-like chromosome segregation protein Spo0J